MSNELRTQYSNAVSQFLTLAKSINPSDLPKVSKPGEWPAAFVIHHMADSEMQFSVRFLNVIAEAAPKILPFDEEAYPQALNYAKRSIDKSLNTISAVSNSMTDIFEIVDPSSWTRKSIHPESGELTMKAILEKVIDHYSAHTNQLKEIKAAL